MSKLYKLRRLWRPAIATHPRSKLIDYELRVPRSGTYTMQWVSDEYVSPRDTALYKVTYCRC